MLGFQGFEKYSDVPLDCWVKHYFDDEVFEVVKFLAQYAQAKRARDQGGNLTAAGRAFAQGLLEGNEGEQRQGAPKPTTGVTITNNITLPPGVTPETGQVVGDAIGARLSRDIQRDPILRNALQIEDPQ